MADDLEDNGPQNDPRIGLAKRRFKRCQNWEARTRDLFLEDLKFDAADSDNGYQWPNDIRRQRDVDERPCLTVNKTRQHNLQIINDAKQNKAGISVRGVGDGASYESAQMLEGIVRHIEYISNADSAYDIAIEFQVKAGIGYCLVMTDYAGDDTFDQEIYIRPVQDPLSVYLDPDIRERDGSDANFGFVFELLPKDEFEEEYPEYKGDLPTPAFGEHDGWVDEDHVRVCTYFWKESKDDKLVSFRHPRTGRRVNIEASRLHKDLLKAVCDDPHTKTRAVQRTEVRWALIIGDEIKEEGKVPGQYIPIARVVGEETIINGELDRKGHTRAMKDPQRMYNYWSSSAVEHVALQGKSPWIAPVDAIEELETYWETANTTNHSVLPYNAFMDDGVTQIPPPTRPAPPMMAQAYLQGMQVAGQELLMVSGQYQSQMGEPGNERSGKAISERQRQGDNATYHFIDNQAIMIRFLGKIILSMIPEVYDTERVLRILAEDGSELELELDPMAQQTYLQHMGEDGKIARRILNPALGKYDVEADVGPAYATRRQEAFEAFTQIITQAPELVTIIGDILLKAGDFPMASEAAERMKRMVPKQALGEGPTPTEAQLQQQLQQLQGLLSKAIEKTGVAEAKLKGKDQLRDIEAYDAETKRLTAVQGFLPMDPEGLKKIISDLVMETLTTTLQPVTDSAEAGLASQGGGAPVAAPAPALGPGQHMGEDGRVYMRDYATSQNYRAVSNGPPVPGAQQATDGQWYVKHPLKEGKFLRVKA